MRASKIRLLLVVALMLMFSPAAGAAAESAPTTVLPDGAEEAKLRKELQGRGLIYFRSGEKLYVVHPDGSGLKVFKDFGKDRRSPRACSISWDGNWIAVSLGASNPKRQELWTMKYDASQARKILELPDRGYPQPIFPAWSPDGKWLAYTHGKELSAMNLATREVKMLMKVAAGTKKQMRELTWSRTWKILVDAGGHLRPHTLQLDENCNVVGEPVRIPGYIGCRKKISPDGTKILVIREASGAMIADGKLPYDYTHRVQVLDALPGAKRFLIPIKWGIDGLVPNTRSQDDCCWSPDGKYVAYLHTPEKEKLEAAGIQFTGPKVLCVCRAEGGPQIWVTDGTPRPSWPIWGAAPTEKGKE